MRKKIAKRCLYFCLKIIFISKKTQRRIVFAQRKMRKKDHKRIFVIFVSNSKMKRIVNLIFKLQRAKKIIANFSETMLGSIGVCQSKL